MACGTRSAEMEVLCFGLCRTGTQSLADSLEMLGYGRIHHMREIISRQEEAQFWTAAIATKLGMPVPCNTYLPSAPSAPTNPFVPHSSRQSSASHDQDPGILSSESFDRFLGQYRGCCDLPSCLFPEEFMAAHPNAKLILTTRPVDKWMASMRSTVIHAWESPHGKPSKMGDLGLSVQKCWDYDFEKNGADFFQRHNERVRQLAKEQGRELFEFDVSEGWDGLCHFLGKQLPAEGFPKSDAWAGYKKVQAWGALPKALPAAQPVQELLMGDLRNGGHGGQMALERSMQGSQAMKT